MKHTQKLFGFLMVAAMAGCGADAGSAGGSPEPTADAEEGLHSGYWVGPISEEPNIHAGACFSNTDGVTAYQCAGTKCDNNYIYCSHVSGLVPTGGTFTTNYFSEENYPLGNYASCAWPDAPAIMVGMQATGNYSDNLSLFCQPITNQLRNCTWTQYYGTSNGVIDLWNTRGNGFAVGVACGGPNCSTVSYQVCTL